MAELEIVGVQYDRDTFKRVLNEGYEAYQLNGPYRVCPYGRDQRNGVWCQGARYASQGYSRRQAWELFKEMEGY